jgi:hypothetical protein
MNLQNKHKFVVVVAITALVMVLSQQQLHPRKWCYHSNNYTPVNGAITATTTQKRKII